ncbi:hypothetical protein NDA03_21325 [Trichocoleus sp. Lan]|uniref:hypothetical protein n=1 Tax=Trichocoleus sp. Lan TaxID=2933927 RepID=UPI00329893B3
MALVALNLETLCDRSRGRLLARVCRQKRLLTQMNPIWLRSLSFSGRCFSLKPETFNNS